MRTTLTAIALLGIVVGRSWTAGAGELRVEIHNGLATIVAKDVTARQILAEWSRVGGTRVVNAEQITGAPLTLMITAQPERLALDAVLRSAGGYLAAERAAGVPGQSIFDAVVIMATSSGVRAPSAPPSAVAPNFSTPSPFRRPGFLRQQPVEDQDQDQDVGDPDEAVPNPAAPGAPFQRLPPQRLMPGAGAPVGTPPQNGTATQDQQPGAPNSMGIHTLGSPVQTTPYIGIPLGAAPVPGISPVPVVPAQPQQQKPPQPQQPPQEPDGAV